VDGFHAGFTLEEFKEYAARRKERAVPGTVGAIDVGFAYFKEHLLTPDGLPRRFSDGRVSFDGQNLAQCIQTLLVCGGETDAGASRIWQLGLERGQLARRGFPALRSSIGPFVLATAFLVRAYDMSRAEAGGGSVLGSVSRRSSALQHLVECTSVLRDHSIKAEDCPVSLSASLTEPSRERRVRGEPEKRVGEGLLIS
jgi:hypothetical protein